jgi:cytochrome c oxidase cbb3-type subunit 3
MSLDYFHQMKIIDTSNAWPTRRQLAWQCTGLLLGLLLAGAGGASLAGQEKTKTKKDSQEKSADLTGAKKAYGTSCAGCHGLDGKGGERAPDIVMRASIRQRSDAALLKILENGIPNTSMPGFNFLSAETRSSLVAYLRQLQGSDKSANLPGDSGRGKEIFFGAGGCSKCHMVRGEGGFFASDMSEYGPGRTAESIRSAILTPNLDADPRRRTVIATLNGGKVLEGLAKNEDNFSIQLLSQDGIIHLLQKSNLVNLTYRNESPMPADYGTRLKPFEIDDLVKFLSTLRSAKRRQEPEEE